jgi:hypothetical protein
MTKRELQEIANLLGEAAALAVFNCANVADAEPGWTDKVAGCKCSYAEVARELLAKQRELHKNHGITLIEYEWG